VLFAAKSDAHGRHHFLEDPQEAQIFPFNFALRGGVKAKAEKRTADAEAPAARPRQHRVTGYAALEIKQP
jgi:hypothetical protein